MEKFKQGDLVILKENEKNFHLRSYFGMVFTVVSVDSDYAYLTYGKDRYKRWFPWRLEKVKDIWEI